MKRYRVRLLGRAKREYAVANAWWRTHCQGAPNALRHEFRAARELLARSPEAGRLDDSLGEEIRRLLLPTVRYLVFYRVDRLAEEVQILALWHASREPVELS